MPSRKKARGRQSRAKKDATRQRTLWEPTILRNNGACNNAAASSCEHMLTSPPQIPQESHAVSFMNCLAGEGFFDNDASFTDRPPMMTCYNALSLSFPGVQKEDNERALAIDLLLRFVRNALVHASVIEGESWFRKRPLNESAICCMIHLLELLGTYSDLAVAKRRACKIGNRLIGGNRRDVVKYVGKRLPCTCMKELHHAVREKVAKVGTCDCCGNDFPRSELLICSGCMVTDYCSKECQRADRSRHKDFCNNPEVMSRFLHSDYIFKRS